MRPVRRVGAAVFLDLIGFGIVLPLLPVAAARYESRALLIGALVATDSLLSFLLQPMWGHLSDRVGRRPVLLLGLAGSTLGYLLFGLAGSFAALLLSRLVSGALSTTITVAQAAMADVTAPERRSHAMGVLGAAFGLAFTIGPALGALASRGDDRAPGLLAAAICGLNFLVALATLPETRRPGSAPARVPERRDALLLPRPAAVVTFGVTLGFTVVYVVFPLYCQQVLGLGRSDVSWLYTVLGLVTAIVQGRLVGRLVPRTGERPLVLWGAGLMTAALLLIPLAAAAAPAARSALLLAGIVLLAAGFGLAGPATAGFVSRGTGPDEQGRRLGALQSVGLLARIVGPPLLGGVVTAAGFGASYGVAAAGCGVALLVAMAWMSERKGVLREETAAEG